MKSGRCWSQGANFELQDAGVLGGGLMDSMVPVVRNECLEIAMKPDLKHVYPLNAQKGTCEVIDVSVNLMVSSFHCVYHHMRRSYVRCILFGHLSLSEAEKTVRSRHTHGEMG